MIGCGGQTKPKAKGGRIRSFSFRPSISPPPPPHSLELASPASLAPSPLNGAWCRVVKAELAQGWGAAPGGVTWDGVREEGRDVSPVHPVSGLSRYWHYGTCLPLLCWPPPQPNSPLPIIEPAALAPAPAPQARRRGAGRRSSRRRKRTRRTRGNKTSAPASQPASASVRQAGRQAGSPAPSLPPSLPFPFSPWFRFGLVCRGWVWYSLSLLLAFSLGGGVSPLPAASVASL